MVITERKGRHPTEDRQPAQGIDSSSITINGVFSGHPIRLSNAVEPRGPSLLTISSSSFPLPTMQDSSNDTVQRFVQAVLRLQKERDEALTQDQLREIAAELGMSDDDVAFIQRATQDHINRGIGFLRHRNWDGAITELMEGATLAPSNPQILGSLAEAHFGRWSEKADPVDRDRARFYADLVLKKDSTHERGLAIISAIDRGERPGRNRGTRRGVLAASLLLVLAGMIGFMTIRRDDPASTPAPAAAPIPEPRPQPPIPAPSPEAPLPSPQAPTYGERLGSFGRKGTGAGMFSNGRVVAADMKGRVYVAGSDKGIINVFDTAGTYLTQFNLELSFIRSMAADHLGTLYVISGARLYRINGETGEIMGEVRGGLGPGYTDVALLPDGSFIAAWDEYAKGGLFINQGSNDRFVRFTAAGRPTKTIGGLMSKALERGASDVRLAVGGDGAIYAVSGRGGIVCHFTADWAFVDRWGEGELEGPEDIAVDGQGRVLILDRRGVKVFDRSGRSLGRIDEQRGRGISVMPNDNLLIVADTNVVRWAIPR